jgi:hypothetical protein
LPRLGYTRVSSSSRYICISLLCIYIYIHMHIYGGCGVVYESTRCEQREQIERGWGGWVIIGGAVLPRNAALWPLQYGYHRPSFLSFFLYHHFLPHIYDIDI